MTLADKAVDDQDVKMSARGVDVYYGDNHAIKNVGVDILKNTVTAFIGPSGCGGNKADLDEVVEKSLRRAAIWDEVKDRLDSPGNGLSGGQQQRLCIARAIATAPQVLLMDEPCSALDPIATAQIEDLIDELRSNYSVVIVTHSMQQAARVSQKTAFFHLGDLVEFGDTTTLFTNPEDKRTRDYITGRFG